MNEAGIPLFFTFPAQPEKSSTAQKGDFIQCGLCPHNCVLAHGAKGKCLVRFNKNGKPDIPFYGYVTALAVDPIEKKPLYHFLPGSQILSIGFSGCNLRCPFCQNWHISQAADRPGQYYYPAEIISKAAMQSIAYTYSEPLVHIEFLLDCMKEARKAGIANVLVSNGCINSGAAGEVLALTDAANIDLKCFSEETYEKVLGSKQGLKTVTDFIQTAVDKKVHIELTTLVVPGLNDSIREMDKCRDFIAELEMSGSVIPWHLSAYHPSFKWDTPATDPDFLIAAAGRAREKLKHVYTGNIAPRTGGKSFNDTLCPRCGNTLVSRNSYNIVTTGLSFKEENGRRSYFCESCGGEAGIRG